MLRLRANFTRHVAVTARRGLRTEKPSKTSRRSNAPSTRAPSTASPGPYARAAPRQPVGQPLTAGQQAKALVDARDEVVRKADTSDFKKMPVPRRIALYGSMAFAAIIAFYSASLYVAATKPCSQPVIKDVAMQKDVAERYNEIADSFDGDVNVSEYLMGIMSLRKRFAKLCTGNVLEVSCGTGRNLGYFELRPDKTRIQSLTFIDLSPQMVQVCKRKWAVHHGGRSLQTGYRYGHPIRFLTGSALESMPLAPDGEKYDTILQTMGMCSTPAPVELVANMAAHLNAANPDARILLLEHGRSYQDWLNRISDNAAEKHAEIHGCWFNRDIGALVEEAAAKAGLEVVRQRRHHLGTTWVIELKAGEEMRRKAILGLRSPSSESSPESRPEVSPKEESSWKSWMTGVSGVFGTKEDGSKRDAP